MSILTTRRQILAGGAALGLAALPSRLAWASAATDKRLVFIIQRGAADGLATLVPTFDPALRQHRASLLDSMEATPLTSDFALHDSLANVRAMFEAGQASFAHAVGLNYRDRSHFDAQNVLETGGSSPYARRDGWMNRLLALLPEGNRGAISVSSSIMPALRGELPSASFSPSFLPDASEDLLQRLMSMYGSTPNLEMQLARALELRGATEDATGRGADQLGRTAAGLLGGEANARVVMLETSGWDTHNAMANRMRNGLRNLDTTIGALRDELGDVWNDTLVLVATEFGRTVRVNGTNGTDHGTASMMMALGGSINGGRIISDWPGLRSSDLLDDRDLRATTSIESTMATSIAQHFDLDAEQAMRFIYPDLARTNMATSLA